MTPTIETTIGFTSSVSDEFIADSKEIAGIAVRGSHGDRSERWEESARRSAGTVPLWPQVAAR